MTAADDYSPAPLRQKLLSEEAYEAVRASILDGTLRPGSQLVESQLARKFSISQAPVRDALRRLSHEGLVTTIPRRGSFVTEVSAQDAAHARDVRNALEELAARTVTGKLTEQHVEQLRTAVAQMRETAEADDIAAFRQHDAAFHRTVIEASGNPYLIRMWTQIEPILNTLGVISNPRFTGDWAAMAEEHAELLELVTGQDPEAASRGFRIHGRPSTGRGRGDLASLLHNRTS